MRCGILSCPLRFNEKIGAIIRTENFQKSEKKKAKSIKPSRGALIGHCKFILTWCSNNKWPPVPIIRPRPFFCCFGNFVLNIC